MKKSCFFSILILLSFFCRAQNVGIGTLSPNASAQLDISSNLRGLLIPRMTTAEMNAVANPAKGLLVLDTTLNVLMINIGTALLPNWQTVAGGSVWNLGGNNGTNPTSNFIGTTDVQPLRFRISNVNAGSLGFSNVAYGYNALNPATSGQFNIAIGTTALSVLTTGNENTAMGDEALKTISTGSRNVGIGSSALRVATTGNDNTAIGTSALEHTTTGFENAAFGRNALFANTTGTDNAAFGFKALGSGVTSGSNCAFGAYASANTTSSSNSSFGDHALYNNTNGGYNAVIGASSMYSNSTGSANTAVGSIALQTNTTGDYNTALGSGADVAAGNFSNATAVGANAYVGASNSMVLGCINGVNGATTGTNVGIGTTSPLATLHVKQRFPNSADGILQEYDNNKKWLTKVESNNNFSFYEWDSFVNGYSLMGYINGSTGQYIQYSDRKLKKNISNISNLQCLQNILRLNPVRYQSAKERSDSNYTYGFIAQEVAPLFPDIVEHHDGINMIGYNSFIPILTKGMQEQQLLIEKLQQQNDDLKTRIEKLEKIILNK